MPSNFILRKCCSTLLAFMVGHTWVLGQFSGFQMFEPKPFVEIPFENHNNYIVLNILFQKMYPMRFLLDTGSKYTILLKREYAEALGFPLDKRYSIIGSDRRTRLNTFILRDVELLLEGVRAQGQSVLVLEENYLDIASLLGTPIDGILGADLFLRFVVRIDYTRQKLVCYEPEAFKGPGAGYTALRLHVANNYPYLSANIKVQGDTLIPARLLLDTGAGLSLLMNLHAKDSGLVREAVPGNIASGLGGQLEGYLGWVREMQFGPFSFHGIVTGYQMPAAIDTVRALERDGLLGNTLLARFQVVVSYADSLLYLKPNAKYRRPFRYDRSGASFRAEGTQLDHYVVNNILRGSPAEAAGLRSGDEVLSMAGWPRFLLNLGRLSRMMARKPGSRIGLVVLRDGKKMRLSMTLRDIFVY